MTQSINFTYMATLMAIVGVGVFAISITAYFNASSETVWVATILSVAQIALGPPLAQAADFWGRKWFVVVCSACGFVGALVISRANSIGVVLVGFAIMSIGYSTQALLTAVASEIITRRMRPLAQGSLIFTGCSGGVIGLLMGGKLLQHGNLANYRVYFYVLAAVYGVATLGCLFSYNPPRRELQLLPLKRKLQGLDWIGYLLFSPSLALFCIALAWAKNPWPWSNYRVLTPLIISFAAMGVFTLYEWKWKTDGIFHHGIVRNRNFALSAIGIWVEGFTFFTINVYLGYEFRLFTGADTLVSNIPTVITLAGCLSFSLIVGAYSSKMKSLRAPIFIAFVLLLIFNILMITVTPSTSRSAIMGYAIFSGAGYGIVVPLLVVALQFSTPTELISLTSGLFIVIRAVGNACAVGINTAVLSGALSTNLVPKITAAVLPLGFPESSLPDLIGALSGTNGILPSDVPGANPEIVSAGLTAFMEAYRIGFRNIWIVGTALTAVACVGKS